MSILSTLEELKGEFDSLEDGFSKYAYLVELAALLPPVDESLRQDDYLFRGCQSQVWLRVQTPEGIVHLDVDSDTLIIRGVLALFRELLEGQPAEAVLEADFDLLKELSIGEHFSSLRTVNIARLLPEIQRRISHDL